MPRKRLRWPLLILVANCLFGTLAALLWLGQKPLPAAKFEFGKQREWRGVVEMLPYPSLRTAGERDPSRLLLVAPGKHGAEEMLKGLEGRAATIAGSLIERDGRRMAEIASIARELDLSPAPPPLKRSLGRSRLEGEIVDSKCFLGVMNPGSGKVHRGCAARCISGGIPPVLRVRDGSTTMYVLLAGERGQPFRSEILEFVAEPVSVEGELFALGDDWLVLHASVDSIRRE